MANRQSCSHLASVTSLPIPTILNSKEYISPLKCADCDYAGPNLWLCLYKNCLKLGCSEKANDHSTIHNATNPMHSIHMNMLTKRMWCYKCSREVFMDWNMNESDHDCENSSVKTRDSGHASYDSLQANTPDRGSDRANIFENSVGLNVGMNGEGDNMDSSENEDDYSVTSRPSGLIGLQNIGNTCYMNAALQALSNTEPLTRFFIDCPYVVQLLSEGRKPGLSRTYQALMRDVWMKKGGQGYVTPSGILYGIRSVHPMFRGFHQHDTQEFLRNFMDQLHEELKQIDSSPAIITTACTTPNTESSSRDDPSVPNSPSSPTSGYDSSEGEYETCDSGVSERSSLSDDGDRPTAGAGGATAKRRLSRCGSPSRRQRQRVQSISVIDSQPGTSSNSSNANKKQTKYRSIISDIFDGKLLSSVQCLTCDRVSSRVETFQDLSLPIPSRDHLVVLHGRSAVAAAAAAGASPGATCSDAVLPAGAQDGWLSWILAWLRSWFYGPTVTLHDCLAAFFSTDELKGDNMYSCEKCNKLRNGVKFSKVLQLPEVLCIHLKRFRHELMFSSKISSAVSFPLKGLDMRPYLHTDCISKVSTYELFSVICHHGTAGGGHYTCFALNAGKWYEFDDQYVTRVDADRVQTCEAYVLFYRKTQSTADSVRHKVLAMLEPHRDDVKRTYVSKQWLNRFYSCAEPGPIDNADFLCQHGFIDPDRDLHLEHLTCVVPLDVYEFLREKFGGAAPLTNLQVCPSCSALSKRLLLEMETFVEISREAQNRDLPHTHYLSTSWYAQWHNFVQKATQEPPGPIDNSRINPSDPDVNEAADVPECIWLFFYNIYGGGPEVKVRPVSIQKTESEDSIPSIADDAPEHRPHEESHPEPPRKEADPGFMIPKLKARRETPKIDRRAYCSGEPMETEAAVNGEVNGGSSGPEADPSDTERLLHDERRSAPGNVEDDADEAETGDTWNRRRHRRRRKNAAAV